jgi:hypothetical protein
MPIVLLFLGAVTTVAGLLLVGSGWSLREGTFQTDILTPGTIATVGGLLLMAFGLAVREMRRIERAFAARPPAVQVRADAPVVVAPPPFAAPADPRHEPPLLPTATIAEVPPDSAVVERLRPKIPTIPRVDNARLAETGELAQALSDNAAFDEGVADVKGLAAVARAANGTGSSVRTAPRLDLKPRLTVAPDKAADKVAANAPEKAKASVFNSFWPTGQRGDADAPQGAGPARAAQDPRAVAQPSLANGAAGSPPATSGSAPVSVLKSGVVEGMAYTLYSDGSIEAQLPQGTLRFGSISALRSHIENNP